MADFATHTMTFSLTLLDNAWLGFGYSPDGAMIGTEAVICHDAGAAGTISVPSQISTEFLLLSRSVAGITPVPVGNGTDVPMHATCTMTDGVGERWVGERGWVSVKWVWRGKGDRECGICCRAGGARLSSVCVCVCMLLCMCMCLCVGVFLFSFSGGGCRRSVWSLCCGLWLRFPRPWCADPLMPVCELSPTPPPPPSRLRAQSQSTVMTFSKQFWLDGEVDTLSDAGLQYAWAYGKPGAKVIALHAAKGVHTIVIRPARNTAFDPAVWKTVHVSPTLPAAGTADTGGHGGYWRARGDTRGRMGTLEGTGDTGGDGGHRTVNRDTLKIFGALGGTVRG